MAASDDDDDDDDDDDPCEGESDLLFVGTISRKERTRKKLHNDTIDRKVMVVEDAIAEFLLRFFFCFRAVVRKSSTSMKSPFSSYP